MLQDLINDSVFFLYKKDNSTFHPLHFSRLLQSDPMTDREDDTIGQLAEDILRRLKALGSFATIELKELVEEAQILIPRDEMDRLLNTYVISDYHYRLLTGPPPLPLVVTPADTQKPPKRHCRACLQINCPDFLNAHQHNAEPSHRCADCFRDFFGEPCLAAHRTS